MTDNYVTEKTFKEFLDEEKRHHVRDETAGAARGRQINEILKKQGEMQTSLDSIAKFRVRVEQKLEKHDHDLYGNGAPGMDEVLRNINAWIAEQKREQAEKWSDTKKFAFGVLAFVVNTLVAIWISKLIP